MPPDDINVSLGNHPLRRTSVVHTQGEELINNVCFVTVRGNCVSAGLRDGVRDLNARVSEQGEVDLLREEDQREDRVDGVYGHHEDDAHDVALVHGTRVVPQVLDDEIDWGQR